MENQGLLSKIGSSSSPRWKLKFLPKFFSASKHIPSALLLLGRKFLKIIRLHRIPPPSKMLRPNIWVEKIENSPCRVPGWLRLSAARSGSDWSKSFPSDFSKMGELRRRRRGEGGRGAPLPQNRGQFGPRQNMLRVSDPFCQNSTSTTVPQPSLGEYSLCRF